MFFFKRHVFGKVIGYELGVSIAGKPIKPVYMYRVGSLLIDSGPHHLRRYVSQILDECAIHTVVFTHHHEDHSGNGQLIQKKTNANLYLHPYGNKKLQNGFSILPYQHLLFGQSPPFATADYPPFIEADSCSFRAIHTPGHSKDHTVFFEQQQGWLFTGDLYLGEKIRFFRVDEHIDQQIASIRNILQLDFDTLFCGHNPVLHHGKKRLTKKLDFLVSFDEQVQDLRKKGYSFKEITSAIRVKNDLPIQLFTMCNASFSHMVRSSLRSSEKHEG